MEDKQFQQEQDQVSSSDDEFMCDQYDFYYENSSDNDIKDPQNNDNNYNKNQDYNMNSLQEEEEQEKELKEKQIEMNKNINLGDEDKRKMVNPIKVLVSKQKKRFEVDGYNLDLSYITDQIIAMGYPAIKYEAMYRNSMSEVQQFFQDRHDKHYRIYNLCSERDYSPRQFNGQVKKFPFEDHQAPSFQLIYQFCDDLHKWLKENPKNVAGIHCKAGKGRTGVMICCYLLYDKDFGFKNAYDALKFYSMQRTKNQKGVTIPSQIRYVLYFEKALNLQWKENTIPDPSIEITKIKLTSVPQFNMFGGCEPWCRISWNKQQKNFQQEEKSSKKNKKNSIFQNVYLSTENNEIKSYKQEQIIEFQIPNIQVKGDVFIEFFNKPILKKNEKMFAFWFNCAFFDPTGVMSIDKNMLDKACKDKKNKKFSKEFMVEIHARKPSNDKDSKISDVKIMDI